MLMKLEVIAKIRTDFPTKFGLPRQSGLVSELCGKIVFEKKYRNPQALRGLEGFSHIWLIWGFNLAKKEDWSPTVRPPRLGGNTRMGVFATRSPFRPNSIGLSCVKLEKIEGDTLYVSGIDLADNTPIYDIKPYLPYADAKIDATGGFAEKVEPYMLEVEFDGDLLSLLPQDKREGAIGMLSQDPRPSYNDDENRIFGVEYAGYDVRFKVKNKTLTVCEVKKI
ncbi:MAG: tRNA (N6-threonylcarbamoyladenosine(37)-N6)-methyltransferase TrmO [Clostridia bacterium]|nr:tRNA (N6-threonylcarbamoyladenosine(37)-N6)-methyltransferase TrmO [Clostridia bacterium]